jgi:hypothetical protein
MLTEFLARLAVALPLVCGLAVLALLAAKRGWFRLPAGGSGFPRLPVPEGPSLQILSVKAVGPAGRLAVVRFAGADHLVGIGTNSFILLASVDGGTPPAPQPAGEVDA